MSRLIAAPLALLVGVAIASPAGAQDRAVVDRLAQFGRMQRREAEAIVRAVNRGLAENAGRDGGYDRVRQVVGSRLFGGPGSNPEEYASRLQQVRQRLRRGLDQELLEALFPAEENSAVLCANGFPITMADCDALVAAASRQLSALPYTAPDDGAALRASLRNAGMSRREADQVVAKLRDVMLGVPRILSRDERGRGLLALLERCPGALRQRESQMRAWHVGPNEGMARCIAEALAARGRQAQPTTQLLFSMNEAQARGFLRWGAPQAVQPPTPTPSPATGPDHMALARAHFQAGRLQQAAEEYRLAARGDATDFRALAGLGAALLRLGDPAGAAGAFQGAARLAPDNATLPASAGDALRAAGRRDDAVAAYRRALSIDARHRGALEGLRALGAPVAPAPAPAPAPTPAPGPAPGPTTAEQWLGQARQLMSQRRFPEAAAAYERAAALAGSDARPFAGLGAARLAMRQAPAAVEAYANAVRLQPGGAGLRTAMARAQLAAGDRGGAIASLRQALAIDPNMRTAQQGLQQLTAPPPAPAAPPAPAGEVLPETPARDRIIAVMRPFQGSVADCAPDYHGRVVFRVTVTGETGEVASVSLEQGPEGAPEIECMVGALQAARFPRFSRPELSVTYPYQL